MTTNICVRYCYDSDIWMDYPKLISEKWNLTAKFNCLDGHYLMCHLHYVSLCVLLCRCGEISALFISPPPKKKKKKSVVILNSSLHYQIFEFDINIQILVWIIGSKSDMSTVNCFTVMKSLIIAGQDTRDEIHMGAGASIQFSDWGGKSWKNVKIFGAFWVQIFM